MKPSGLQEGETLERLVGRLETVSEQTLTSADQPALTDSRVLGKQIVAAVRESAHKDVSTSEEAFEAVESINVRQLRDPEGGDVLTVIHYSAGGNTYGAVFKQNEALPTAAIRDGDVALKP